MARYGAETRVDRDELRRRLGEVVNDLRVVAGISHRELAERVNRQLGRETWRPDTSSSLALPRKRGLYPEEIVALARVFGCTTDHILTTAFPEEMQTSERPKDRKKDAPSNPRKRQDRQAELDSSTRHRVLESILLHRDLPPPDVRRALRESRGLSQDELAAAVGCSRASISYYETTSRAPRTHLLDRYVEAIRALRDMPRDRTFSSERPPVV